MADAGLWQVYIGGELTFETFDEDYAIFQFEHYVEDGEVNVELVKVLKTTAVNEILTKNKKLSTDGKWSLIPNG